MSTAAPASRPPHDLPGLDPSWSTLVEAAAPDGVKRTWHVLDAGPPQPVGTLLCVHGNPTWSYTFRSILQSCSDRWRIIAPDHLGMGFSERTGTVHRLADRVDELDALTTALDLDRPVVIVAHDWGGSIALGWTERHVDKVAGIVLLNTAISQPVDAKAPRLIRLAHSPIVTHAATQRTQSFLRGTLRLAHPALPREVAAAYRAPYTSAGRRQAIADFVADIPIEHDHPSRKTLDQIATDLKALRSIPTLLLWGPRDPVFTGRYLRDLQSRLPQAQTHRFEGSGHLVIEDAPVAAAVRTFADSVHGTEHVIRPSEITRSGEGASRQPLWAHLTQRAADESDAVVQMGRRGPRQTVSWRQLNEKVESLAAGFSAVGVAPGDRVALLVPPSTELTATLYACWRAGAVPVVADAGLGLTGLRRALRGARTSHTVGTAKGLSAAAAMGLPGTVIAAGNVAPGSRFTLGIDYTLAELSRLGRSWQTPPGPAASAEAAVLFTSGATGPAKGVVYRHRQLEAQRDAVREAFGVRSDDRLVAAFAPFALFGPALGITSVVPHMNVTRPGTLTARDLVRAVTAVDASLVFAAPAALRNIVATAHTMTSRQRDALTGVRLLLSAGAPVPAVLLRQAADLFGDCEAHTPYGMTEALPVTDVTLDEIESSGEQRGVLVGKPLPSVQVAISPLSADGAADGALTDSPDITGEICVRAAHVKDHYDQLWLTQSESARDLGWHRTGDVGHLDTQGRLWVEGRLAHVITTASGIVTPVGIEQSVTELDGVVATAAVGVGPPRGQVVVVVVEMPTASPGSAPVELIDAVRSCAAVDIAAVLTVPKLPVDVRHNSKIDRAHVARWADRVLAGHGDERP